MKTLKLKVSPTEGKGLECQVWISSGDTVSWVGADLRFAVQHTEICRTLHTGHTQVQLHLSDV